MRGLVGVLLLCLPAEPRAQFDFAKADAAIEYALDEQGRLLISPSPFEVRGGFTPLVSERLLDVVTNAGVIGFVSYLFAGDTDVASFADGGVFFARLGRDSDVELLHALAADGDPAATPLQRLLAVRVTQDRRFKPALGVLERMTEDRTLDAHLRGAVGESIAALRGKRSERQPPTLPPLAAVLADAPVAADAYMRIDEFRLPPARALLRSAVPVALENWRRWILSEGGMTQQFWTRGQMISAAAALLPYEIARRFGNARVHRVVLALRMPPRVEPRQLWAHLQFWAHLDGSFDVAALRAGLTAANLAVNGDDERITCQIMPGIQLTAATNQLRVHRTGFSGGTSAETASALAQAIEQDGAPIVVHLDDKAALPEVERFGRPQRLAVWIPRTPDGEARFHLRCSDQRLPQLIAGELRGLQGKLAQWVTDDPSLAILADVYTGVSVAADDSSCTVSVKCDFDLGAALLAIVPSGLLR